MLNIVAISYSANIMENSCCSTSSLRIFWIVRRDSDKSHFDYDSFCIENEVYDEAFSGSSELFERLLDGLELSF
jgi:hypothetical protein